jgi:hypothetical protein
MVRVLSKHHSLLLIRRIGVAHLMSYGNQEITSPIETAEEAQEMLFEAVEEVPLELQSRLGAITLGP